MNDESGHEAAWQACEHRVMPMGRPGGQRLGLMVVCGGQVASRHWYRRGRNGGVLTPEEAQRVRMAAEDSADRLTRRCLKLHQRGAEGAGTPLAKGGNQPEGGETPGEEAGDRSMRSAAKLPGSGEEEGPPELLTRKECAAMLGVRPESINEYMKHGDWPRPIMIGTQQRWRLGDVKEYLGGREASGLLTMKQCTAMARLSAETINRYMKHGDWPRPIMIGGQRRWRLGDIEECLGAKLRMRSGEIHDEGGDRSSEPPSVDAGEVVQSTGTTRREQPEETQTAPDMARRGRKPPSLKALRAFEAAARHMSVGGAAGELQITAQAIGHLVRSLETYLDQSLFVRLNPAGMSQKPAGMNQSLELTAAGQRLLPGLSDGFKRIAESVDGLLASSGERAIRDTATERQPERGSATARARATPSETEAAQADEGVCTAKGGSGKGAEETKRDRPSEPKPRIRIEPGETMAAAIARERQRQQAGEGGSWSRRAKLTEADVHQIRELGGNITTGELAVRFGVSQSCIRRVRNGQSWSWLDPEATAGRRTDGKGRALGGSNGGSKLEEKDVRQIVKLRGQATQKELAQRFGVSVNTIVDIHTGKTWNSVTKIRRRRRRGSQGAKGSTNWRAKLTREEVHQIRRLQGKLTAREMAKGFGVSVSCIKAIHTGRSWSWLRTRGSSHHQ